MTKYQVLMHIESDLNLEQFMNKLSKKHKPNFFVKYYTVKQVDEFNDKAFYEILSQYVNEVPTNETS